MEKNMEFKGICSDYTSEGLGVVKYDGFPFFVNNIIKGEEASFVVTKMKKGYGFARALTREVNSPERVEPLCPVYRSCGGCQLQHMSKEEQASFKQDKVTQVMRRIAKVDTLVNPIITSENEFYYRNKGQIPVGLKHNKVLTGFYRLHSNDIIDIEECMIQSPMINQVMVEVKQLFQSYKVAQFFKHILIKHAIKTDEVMVVLIAKQRKIPKLDMMVQELVKGNVHIESVILNVNEREDNVILGKEEHLLFGEPMIYDKLHELTFSISSKSFYQINPQQTEVLYETAMKFAGLDKDETALDLYCGVGSISLHLAKQCKQVTGIELIPEAIIDARRNAKRNKIKNVEFICSDAATFAKQVVKDKAHFDVILVDPPRKGCDQQALDAMVEIAPSRIVYVSCDPATLARDLNYLNQNGYIVEQIQPVDMFPQTHHVESIVKLVKNQL